MISCLLSFSAYVFAETSIKAEVDKTSLTTDDSLTYKITIESTDKKVSDLKLSEFKGFAVISQLQSSSIAFEKGKSRASVVYSFILAPVETGRLFIGPASVSVGRQVYSTDSFEIQVTQGKAKPEKPSPPEENPPEAGSDMPQFTL
jgi:hypothetical protein